MRRREFLGALGGAAAAWPLAASAQQPAKVQTVGFLGASTAAAQSHWTAAFVQRLRQFGWIEGSTVAIEYRWGEGRTERFAEFVAEFVRLKVDVIVTHGTAVPAAKEATSVIPIVFAMANDPVGRGLVASPARPGGNVTGLSLQSTDLAGKRLELLRELSPVSADWRLWPMSPFPARARRLARFRQRPARSASMSPRSTSGGQRISRPLSTLSRAVQTRCMSQADPFVNTNRIRINTLTLSARLPTMHAFREYVEAGGLMSYGPNPPDMWRRAAEFADKILRGTKPADLPVEQPTSSISSSISTTAKALGLTIPELFLLRASDVIE